MISVEANDNNWWVCPTASWQFELVAGSSQLVTCCGLGLLAFER